VQKNPTYGITSTLSYLHVQPTPVSGVIHSNILLRTSEGLFVQKFTERFYEVILVFIELGDGVPAVLIMLKMPLLLWAVQTPLVADGRNFTKPPFSWL
jgi:hypothetical protein